MFENDIYKEDMVEKAYRFATIAHENQYDKGGKPYIEHVLKVASNFTKEYETRIVALLHDVIEDTMYTIEDIKAEGFEENIINALKVITRNEDMDYKVYVEKIASNKIACKVKIADLKHNMDISRINEPTEQDYRRIEKYKKALVYLEEKLNGEDIK